MSKCDYLGYKYLVSAKVLKPNSAISNLKTSKEEKKMHKKTKVNGHVLHKLPKCVGLYYTVEPEHSCIAVYRLKYDEETGEPCYHEFEDICISAKQLGWHGYLESKINYLVERHSGNTIFEEEKKMIEYYVIDVEMTDADLKTKRTECLQIRQSGNYFEIPFDGPADISEYRLDRLEKCLHDYILETNKWFRVSVEKSSICSNSVLKITTPYGDISDDANREELCKMLTYAAEHKEYPGPEGGADLAKICFYLRECNNREIYKKVCFVGIDCDIRIRGRVARNGVYLDYIPAQADVTELRFKNGRLTHFMLIGNPGWEEAAPGKIPGVLYYIYHHDKPFQHVDEVKSLLGDAYDKRAMWKNASYIIFSTLAN